MCRFLWSVGSAVFMGCLLMGNVLQAPLKDKKILLMCAVATSEATSGLFGSSAYRLQLYKLLRAAGVNVTMLVDQPTIEQECDRIGLSYKKCQAKAGHKGPLTRQQERSYLVNDILKICNDEHIDILHCNVGDERELEIAQRVQQKYSVKVMLTLHHEDLPRSDLLRGVEGIVGVSPQIQQHFEKELLREGHKIKHITWIAPFFDQTRFTSFVPTRDRKAFFKETFNIDVTHDPIVCMVGLFYKNAQWKNHEILVRAVNTLIKKHGRRVQVMFAGDGPRKAYVQDVVRQLKLEKNIHFLGYTRQVPELLYHSDINVLTSTQEGFGIALMEGALMGKALVGTRGTGMENIIKHGTTGLLFEKGDCDDLAKQLERLISNLAYARELGQGAHLFMQEHYTTEKCLEKMCAFYAEILKK